uniref:RAP domain-containing protein n=1 Tax=Tetradesmus obliquus TaxID=3088 RepID=A0A383WBY4_TETOB|eukprot:jgi/Sobl393_1/4/SZX74743.1
MLAHLQRSLLAPAPAAASGRQCTSAVRPKPSRSKQLICPHSKSRDAEPAPEATDEELLRQLNSGHLWLPEESDDDFGLDDVAAHLANRNQAQRLDLAAAGRAAAGRKKRKAGPRGQQQAAPSTLGEIDPASGKLPGWVAELQGAGFDVLGRNGELFLQRGAVPQQPSSSSSSSSSSKGAKADSQAKRLQQAATGSQPPAQRQQQQQQVAGGAAVSDRSLAVRSEFDPLLWQQPGDGNAAATSAADFWCTQSAGGGSATSSGAAAVSNAAAGSVDSSSSSSRAQPGQASSAAARAKACREVQRRLLGFKQPEQLLAYIERCFPDWAANGCWLLHQQRAGVVPAPTPAEAAAALKGVALAAKRAGLGAAQTQGLARDRRVLGLVECLRLAAPRAPAHQDPAISQRLWSIAKAYWLQAGAAATAAQQQLLAAARVAAANGQGWPAGSSSSSSSSSSAAALNGSAVPSLGPLLAGLQAAGLSLSREQLAAAQSLISARQEDALRQQAWVAALWGLAAIGGPLFFTAEVDALAQVAALSRWQLSSFELSDVLWALASSRHWSPLLGQLEASLMAAGAPAACSAPELITALWAFATLSHTPQQLLAALDARGWCVRPSSELPAAQRGSLQQKRPAKAGKQQRDDAASDSSSSSSCRLCELSGSQLSALVWSLACLQQVDGALFRQAWLEVCRRGPGLADAGDVRSLVRVHQAALAVSLEASYGPTELFCDAGTRHLLDTAAKAFKQQSGALQSKVHSTYQRGIASSLTKMRLMHVLEDNTTGYAVDISLPGLRLAIEADGPSHMARNRTGKGGRVMLGATAMKRRHLQGLGWAVLNVAYSDWDALTGEAQRAAFLKQQVAAALAAAGRPPQPQQRRP